jgi:ribosomal protein S18 acetylase RimI-like enzyme
MTKQSGYLIRDALATDIETCLAIDHTYQSDYVWQMAIQRTNQQTNVTFRQERLPRTLEGVHRHNEARLRYSLQAEHCFIIATTHSGILLGYLTMYRDVPHHRASLQDIVVDKPYRRHGIARKLLHIAKTWALEHDLTHLMMPTSTKNEPAIQCAQSHGLVFCGYNDQYYSDQEIALFWGQSL